MSTNFKRSDLAYDDYKWNADADHDNPKMIGGNDRSQLNRTEGYEMLYFIRSLSKTWNWTKDHINSCKRLEQIIKTEVPASIRTHAAIKEWISSHYPKLLHAAQH